MENESREIRLEEYKKAVSLYKNYREQISKYHTELRSLEEREKSFDYGVGYLLYILSVSVIFMLFFNGNKQADFLPKFILSIVFAIFAAVIPTAILGGILEGIFGRDFLNFLNNLLSSGKLNKIKKLQEETEEQIRGVEELERGIYEKIHPFENKLREHYLAKMAGFFKENLYNKRSGNQQFEENLSEFSSMIEEISKLDSIFVTTKISYWDLEEHKRYLEKRTINHNLQATKKNEILSSVQSFTRSFSEPQKPKNFVAPERLYRTARKIDNWEEINKKRKMTGLKGEEIAVVIEQEFFKSIGRNDLAQKVRHVSAEDGDGLGYDVLSFFENGREKYIEVKSTTASLSSPFYLSRNELGFLKEHSESAFIYRVLISGDEPQIKTDSSREFLEKNDFIPVQYMVRVK